MSKTETLAYFDPSARTTVTVDASPFGLGCILSQKIAGVERVIAYGHRSLSSVERRYSQTEREALAIVWGCEHFAMYLIGLQFRLVTDHRPLQFIFNKVQSRPSARIERWVLRLMAFDYEVVYKPGKENIADPLSRLSASPDCIRNVANVADEYVHTVARLSVPKAMSFDEVKKASIDCSEMKLVRDALLDGRWSTCLPAYRSVYTELSDVEGVVMRGNNIVMPVVLRAKAVELAHEGHQGIEKTKHLLRSKLWWPGMDKEAEVKCRECHECQVVSAPSKPPPMVSTKMPDRPWEHIACDILGPLPNGESVFVVVDYYSRYFEVCFLKSTQSDKITAALDSIICRWGVPLSVRTDNGPQFVSSEFQEFLQSYGIYWLSTTPMWPAANGEVERQNRSLLKSLKIAHMSGKDYKAELRRFLLAYRSTPHTVTGVAPGELMMGRPMRTKLPCLERQESLDGELRDHQALAQEKSRALTDEGRSQDDIIVGDKVLVRQAKTDKLSSTFHPLEQKVVGKHGSEVVVESSEGKRMRRNVSEVKRFVQRGSLGVSNNGSSVDSSLASSGVGTADNAGNIPDKSSNPAAPEEGQSAKCDTPIRPLRVRNMPVRYGNPISH